MYVPTNGNNLSSGRDFPEEFPLETELDEAALARLDSALGRLVLSATLWAEPIVEAVLEEVVEGEDVVDLDLYLEGNVLLELYGAVLYEDEASPHLRGLEIIANSLTRHVERGTRLVEIAEEEETGAPIFIFEDEETGAEMLILADGWVLDSWETLPDEED